MSSLQATASAADGHRAQPFGQGLIDWLRSSPYTLIAALAVLASLPTLIPPVLPLTDLGGHLGRFAVQLDGGRDPHLAAWYSFSWRLLPNLGTDILVQALAPLLGLEPAVRAIVTATVFLQAFGILAISRVLHGRITPFALFALPFIYAHSFLYGFLNYTLALGLLWCSLALWIALSEDARPRWAVFAIVATIIWVCHLVGWALLCIAAGSQELTRQWDQKRALVPAIVASVPPLSCLLVPWLVKLLTFQPSSGSGKSEGFFLMSNKLDELLQVFRDRWHALDLASLVLIVVLIVASWLTRWTRLNKGMTLAAAITAICVIVVPQRLLGSFFADQRLVEPALLFAVLAIGLSGRAPARLSRALLFAAVLFAGVRLSAVTASLWQLGHRSEDDLKVLEALPRNAQLVTFRALPCPPPKTWTFDRWTHLAGYAVARRHAFANDQWQVPGGQLLRVHNPSAGRFQADDSQTIHDRTCHGKPGVAAEADEVPSAIPFLWVIWSGEPRVLNGWEPLDRHGRSVLYHRPSASDALRRGVPHAAG